MEPDPAVGARSAALGEIRQSSEQHLAAPATVAEAVRVVRAGTSSSADLFEAFDADGDGLIRCVCCV